MLNCALKDYKPFILILFIDYYKDNDFPHAHAVEPSDTENTSNCVERMEIMEVKTALICTLCISWY